MRYLSSLTLCSLFFTFTALADNPPGFEADTSKPAPMVNATPTQADIRPPSSQSQSAWHNYNQPIRHCVQGDTILPTANNKVLNFLFNNESDTNATMSIQGWKASRCLVTFSEGTLVKSCQLKGSTLDALMQQLINPSQFDITSKLAQDLTAECQNGAPA